jgi:hypothetical protein
MVEANLKVNLNPETQEKVIKEMQTKLRQKGLVGGTVTNLNLSQGSLTMTSNNCETGTCHTHVPESIYKQYGISLSHQMEINDGDVVWAFQQEELYVAKGVALTEGIFLGIDGAEIAWSEQNLKELARTLLYKPIGLLHPQMMPDGRSPNVGTIINLGFSSDYKKLHMTYLVVNAQLAEAINKGELGNSIEARGMPGPPNAEGKMTIENVRGERVALVPDPACEVCVNYDVKTVRLSTSDVPERDFRISFKSEATTHDTQIIKNTDKTDKSISRGMESMSDSDQDKKELTAKELMALLAKNNLVVTQKPEEQSMQLSNNPYPVHGQDPANAKTAGMGDFIGNAIKQEMVNQTEFIKKELEPIKEQLAKNKESAQVTEINVLKEEVRKGDPEVNFEVELAGLTQYCDIKNTLTGMIKGMNRLANLAKGKDESTQGSDQKTTVTPPATEVSAQLSAGEAGSKDDKGKKSLKDLEADKVKKFEGLYT